VNNFYWETEDPDHIDPAECGTDHSQIKGSYRQPFTCGECNHRIDRDGDPVTSRDCPDTCSTF
jgi:hypothetical protein